MLIKPHIRQNRNKWHNRLYRSDITSPVYDGRNPLQKFMFTQLHCQLNSTMVHNCPLYKQTVYMIISANRSWLLENLCGRQFSDSTLKPLLNPYVRLPVSLKGRYDTLLFNVTVILIYPRDTYPSICGSRAEINVFKLYCFLELSHTLRKHPRPVEVSHNSRVYASDRSRARCWSGFSKVPKTINKLVLE